MSKVGKAIQKVISPGAGAAAKAQERQARLLREEKERQDAVEAGLKRAGASGSFMGFIDDRLKDVLG